jgi:hypothetical protein
MIGHARDSGSGSRAAAQATSPSRNDFTVSQYGVNAELIGKTMGVKP